MKFTRTSLIATGVALILSGPVMAQDSATETASEPAAPEVAKIVATADTVVATVNGEQIKVGHIVALGERLPAEYRSLDAQTLFDRILDQLIQQALLASRVDGQSKSIKFALENESRALLATEAVNDIGAAAVTEEAVQTAYQADYASIESAPDFFASHILVATEDEAKTIIADLETGGDFAEIAKEKSTGPSGVDGGELGWISAGQTVAPFENAVRALEPGQLSAPIETQFGWHVIKLAEFRDAVPPTLTEVREAIEAGLSDKAIEDGLRILDEGAEIDRQDAVIDPSVVTDATLLDN